MLVSAIHQHESATGIHVSSPSQASLPSPTPSHPSRLSEHWAEVPMSHRKFPLAIYFTYQQNEQPNQKMGKRPKLMFLQRHTDG